MASITWDEIPEESVRAGVKRRGFGTSQCLLVMNECTPGMDLNPHVHEFDQIAMIVSGQAHYYVGDQKNEMGPGSILLVPAGKTHYIEPIGNEVVKNIDIFAPARSDLMHLLTWSASEDA